MKSNKEGFNFIHDGKEGRVTIYNNGIQYVQWDGCGFHLTAAATLLRASIEKARPRG